MPIFLSKEEVQLLRDRIANSFTACMGYIPDVRTLYNMLHKFLVKGNVMINPDKIQLVRVEYRDAHTLDLYIYLETVMIDLEIHRDNVEIYITPLMRVDCSS
jgi:hypothetical protein